MVAHPVPDVLKLLRYRPEKIHNGPETPRLHLHLHDLLISVRELVANLEKQPEGNVGLGHRHEHTGQIVALPRCQVGNRLVGLRRLGARATQKLTDDLREPIAGRGRG